jgi:dinuclear metal center YbgI/SA1388 family protein
MNVADISRALEQIAPPRYAESWDNVGLLIGRGERKVKRLMLCIDLTEAVVAEAGRAKAQMAMAYHSVIFKPIPRLTDRSAGPALEAAEAGLAVHSMHTAWDAVIGGSSDALADVLRLAERAPIDPTRRPGQCKLVTFCPPDDRHAVAEAAFAAGAGRVGDYDRCTFALAGRGTFRGGEGTNPTVGRPGREEHADELRLELVAPASRAGAVHEAIRAAHRYEEPVVDVYSLDDCPPGVGMGRIGRLDRPVTAETILGRVRKATGVKRLMVARPPGQNGGAKVHRAACCPGAGGSFALPAAAAGATLFLTGEMRHHELLAATRAGVTCVCTGHSNSERLSLPRIADRLAEMLPALDVVLSEVDADPLQIV